MPRESAFSIRRASERTGPRHPCDHPGCELEGDYRAPKSRHAREGHYLFCLEHVRQYNAAWDFFAGMNQVEIENYQRNNSTWHRPTWRLGVRGGDTPGAVWIDPFDFMSEANLSPDPAAEVKPMMPKEQKLALGELDLPLDVTLNEIKTRYKQLVKMFHPDVTGGDKMAEERFKRITKAYTYLMSCGYT